MTSAMTSAMTSVSRADPDGGAWDQGATRKAVECRPWETSDNDADEWEPRRGRIRRARMGPPIPQVRVCLSARVPKYETKLKLGRKLDDVDAATASDNQVSVLFRHDEDGEDAHVSFSIESDAMSAEDVHAVLMLLDQRGLFTRANSKTWVSQPQASEARFGETREWQGASIDGLVSRLVSHLPRPDLKPLGQASGESALARLREAERRVAEMEKALAALKAALATPGTAPSQ